MRGQIIKRKSGKYAVIVSLGKDSVTGKYRQKWETVKGTKKDAEKRLAELLHQQDTGVLMKPGKTTLGDFLQRWLRDYAMTNLSPRTVEGYANIIQRFVIPSMGTILLSQLRGDHLQKYYADSMQRVSAITVRHHAMLIHGALNHAVKWGLLIRNPADSVTPPRAKRKEMHIMTESDIQRFLEAAKDTQYYSIFYMALFTGLRRSELLGLRWADVDLLGLQISVKRGLHKITGQKNVVFAEPKTVKSRRTVALSPSTDAMLRDLLQLHTDMRLLLTGVRLTENDLVFSQADGRPILPSAVTHNWVKLARKVGLSGIRLHDARHTHASLLLKQGIHPKVVSERLGHSSITITLDTYSHVVPGLQEAAAAGFDKILPKLEQEVSGIIRSKFVADPMEQ